jgi:methionine-R-sulfoxide reductase
MQHNSLTPEEKHVIEDKGTERPFTGKYDDFWLEGTYVCRRCNTPLYESTAKFHSGCGWPSFDQEIPGKVKRLPTTHGWDWQEIECATCGAHLGHVFLGEGFTEKNTRHCVNSLSMRFVPKEKSS